MSFYLLSMGKLGYSNSKVLGQGNPAIPNAS